MRRGIMRGRRTVIANGLLATAPIAGAGGGNATVGAQGQPPQPMHKLGPGGAPTSRSRRSSTPSDRGRTSAGSRTARCSAGTATAGRGATPRTRGWSRWPSARTIRSAGPA